MNVLVSARLFVPPDRLFFGGCNLPLLTIVRTVDISISTPLALHRLLEGSMELDGIVFQVESYDMKTNAAALSGSVARTGAQYLRMLEGWGWKLDEDALRRYCIDMKDE